MKDPIEARRGDLSKLEATLHTSYVQKLVGWAGTVAGTLEIDHMGNRMLWLTITRPGEDEPANVGLGSEKGYYISMNRGWKPQIGADWDAKNLLSAVNGKPVFAQRVG